MSSSIKIPEFVYFSHMGKSNVFIFDAYGTLFRINADNKELNTALGNDKTPFLNLWRTKLLNYTWQTTLMGEWVPFNSIVSKALKFACAVYKLDLKMIKPLLLQIYENPTLYSDAKNCLSVLKKAKHQCCIMSNGEPSTLNKAISTNEINALIDKVFSASHVKKYKVSQQVYRMATVYFNTGPSNMYFVSSNAWDICGANNFGYKTIWVNRNNTIFDTLTEAPNFTINSLSELDNIVSLHD